MRQNGRLCAQRPVPAECSLPVRGIALEATAVRQLHRRVPSSRGCGIPALTWAQALRRGAKAAAGTFAIADLRLTSSRKRRFSTRPPSGMKLACVAVMKRILVALDGSERAPMVLAEAKRLATEMGATLILFRAIGLPVEVPMAIWQATDLDLSTVLMKTAQGELATLAESVPKALIEDVAVQLGVPWDAICSVARARNVDLIVMGSHGYRGLDHVLGTTAARVVNHADRSVLVVRTATGARTQS
jgi:nucleotide-binding universal stress UspA family protein